MVESRDFLLVKGAFTLLETLVAFAVIAVLVVVAIPATTRVSRYAARSKTVSNLRQLGVAAHLYANDHNQELPGRPAGGPLPPLDGGSGGGDWPQLFSEYLTPSDPRVFLDPQDRQTAQLPLLSVLSGPINNTGYLYNGFNDLNPGGPPPTVVPLNRLLTPSEVILLAPKTPGATVFYADVLLQPLVNLFAQFNPKVYDGGAYYLFADGSVRFLSGAEYSNNFWLSDKSITLPTMPLIQNQSQMAGAAPQVPDRG